jgi:hypothetical protein
VGTGAEDRRIPNMSSQRLPIAFTVAAMLVGKPVGAEEIANAGGRDVASVFFVARNTNRNQVHYGIHLDAACRPVGPVPVYGYWRMLERGGEIEPILGIELPAYGLREEQQIKRQGDTTSIRVQLRALPERPVTIFVTATPSGCEAFATTSIAGMEAKLSFVYVKVKWPFGVDHVLLRGRDREGGRRVEEVIHDGG